MAWKRLTFILIPHSQSRVKQISIPRAFIFGAVLFLVLAIGIMIFYILGFKGKSFYLKKTREIVTTNTDLKKHLAFFDSTLSAMSIKIDSIDKVNESIPEKFDISERDLKLNGVKRIKVARSGLELPLNRVLYLIERMDKKSMAFEHNFSNLFNYCDKISDYLKHLPSIRPAEGFITKEFEYSFDIVANERKLHPGVDINNVEGTPVVATADGIIEEDKYSNKLGRYIVINHQNGYKTRYTHLQRVAQMDKKIKLNAGEKVTRGQQIGCIGRTGISILAVPAHVMYSVEHHGNLVNPADYFFAPDFTDENEKKTSVAQNL